MPDELPRLGTRRGEAQRVDHVVQPHLEQAQEVLARHALLARGLGEVAPELRLQNAVDAAHLLLLAELQPVGLHLVAPLAVLAGRVRAPLDRALLLEAPLPLEEELHPLATAKPTHRLVISCHCYLLAPLDPAPLRRPTPVVRDRRHVLDALDLEPRRRERADRGLAPGPWSLELHVDACARRAPGPARPRCGRRAGPRTACPCGSPCSRYDPPSSSRSTRRSDR